MRDRGPGYDARFTEDTEAEQKGHFPRSQPDEPGKAPLTKRQALGHVSVSHSLAHSPLHWERRRRHFHCARETPGWGHAHREQQHHAQVCLTHTPHPDLESSPASVPGGAQGGRVARCSRHPTRHPAASHAPWGTGRPGPASW